MFFSFTCECEYSDRILIQHYSVYLSNRIGQTEKKWPNLTNPPSGRQRSLLWSGVAVVMVGLGAALLYFLSGNPTLAPSIRI